MAKKPAKVAKKAAGNPGAAKTLLIGGVERAEVASARASLLDHCRGRQTARFFGHVDIMGGFRSSGGVGQRRRLSGFWG